MRYPTRSKTQPHAAAASDLSEPGSLVARDRNGEEGRVDRRPRESVSVLRHLSLYSLLEVAIAAASHAVRNPSVSSLAGPYHRMELKSDKTKS